MRLDLEDAGFRATIVSWLQELSDEVVTDLNLVFDRSPGTYPTTLLELWRGELRRRGLTSRSTSQQTPSDEPSYERLPVGHQADSDWRFTPESTLKLVRLALEAAAPEEPVVHLGTPSTFLISARSDAHHRHVLLDRNTTVLNALVSHEIGTPHLMIGIDLQAIGQFYLNAGAAIVDPPWYLDHTLLFLSVAAEVCRSDATILLCQPCVGTRPRVDQERAVLLDRASALGLDLHAVQSRGVRYVTPHFEAISLRAAAYGTVIPTGWRRGDVLLFKRSTRPSTIFRPLIHDPKWREARFGPVRVKLAEQPTGSDVGSLVPGNVLVTVSRRDPIRSRIGLWTSGNRVFTIANPLLIGQLIELCDADLMDDKFDLQHEAYSAILIGGVSPQLNRGLTRSTQLS